MVGWAGALPRPPRGGARRRAPPPRRPRGPSQRSAPLATAQVVLREPLCAQKSGNHPTALRAPAPVPPPRRPPQPRPCPRRRPPVTARLRAAAAAASEMAPSAPRQGRRCRTCSVPTLARLEPFHFPRRPLPPPPRPRSRCAARARPCTLPRRPALCAQKSDRGGARVSVGAGRACMAHDNKRRFDSAGRLELGHGGGRRTVLRALLR